ncbi:MAG: D-glycero-beta-D-manno-heptose 1-phosphate adenylyltransferase [Candidatus Sericytochromatia bacterium]
MIIKNNDNLKEIISGLKSKSKTIALTNGCFDILHIGHARYLKQAKELADILIVGINSDSSVKQLKGENRPINNENDRAELLSYFKFIDYVVIFNEKTADNLLLSIKPDIYVKGGDYTKESLPEKNSIDKINANVAFIDFVNGYSTTNIINRSKNNI